MIDGANPATKEGFNARPKIVEAFLKPDQTKEGLLALLREQSRGLDPTLRKALGPLAVKHFPKYILDNRKRADHSLWDQSLTNGEVALVGYNLANAGFQMQEYDPQSGVTAKAFTVALSRMGFLKSPETDKQGRPLTYEATDVKVGFLIERGIDVSAKGSSSYRQFYKNSSNPKESAAPKPEPEKPKENQPNNPISENGINRRTKPLIEIDSTYRDFMDLTLSKDEWLSKNVDAYLPSMPTIIKDVLPEELVHEANGTALEATHSILYSEDLDRDRRNKLTWGLIYFGFMAGSTDRLTEGGISDIHDVMQTMQTFEQVLLPQRLINPNSDGNGNSSSMEFVSELVTYGMKLRSLSDSRVNFVLDEGLTHVVAANIPPESAAGSFEVADHVISELPKITSDEGTSIDELADDGVQRRLNLLRQTKSLDEAGQLEFKQYYAQREYLKKPQPAPENNGTD